MNKQLSDAKVEQALQLIKSLITNATSIFCDEKTTVPELVALSALNDSVSKITMKRLPFARKLVERFAKWFGTHRATVDDFMEGVVDGEAKIFCTVNQYFPAGYLLAQCYTDDDYDNYNTILEFLLLIFNATTSGSPITYQYPIVTKFQSSTGTKPSMSKLMDMLRKFMQNPTLMSLMAGAGTDNEEMKSKVETIATDVLGKLPPAVKEVIEEVKVDLVPDMKRLTDEYPQDPVEVLYRVLKDDARRAMLKRHMGVLTNVKPEALMSLLG